MTDIVTQVAIDLGLHNAPVVQEDTSWRFNRSHGSLYDRGSSDSYYRRPQRPHYGGVGGNTGPRVEVTDPADVAEYLAGYEYNESQFFFKEW